jgi:hypothetical protein
MVVNVFSPVVRYWLALYDYVVLDSVTELPGYRERQAIWLGLVADVDRPRGDHAAVRSGREVRVFVNSTPFARGGPLPGTFVPSGRTAFLVIRMATASSPGPEIGTNSRSPPGRCR